MKLLKAFGIAFVLAMLSMIGYIWYMNNTITAYYHVNDNSVRYNFEYSKYKGRDILLSNIDDKTLVALGSSEFQKASNQPFHFKQLFNYDDFHLMPIGGGNFQNIIHAANIGSMGDYFPQKKVVLIESFLWFDQYGLQDKAFENRMSKEHIYYTLTNPKLSDDTKQKFMTRVLELTDDNSNLHKTFERYKMRLLDHQGSFIDDWLIQLDVAKSAFDNKVKFYELQSVKPIPSSGTTTPNYDWGMMKTDFAKDAVDQTNNNDFDIVNSYYTEQIASKLDKLKNYASKYRYTKSKEYNDFQLVLQMAKELGLDVEVVNLSVNAKWFDYIGIGEDQRSFYASKISEITKTYGYQLVDLTSHEYEPYFLYDTVHPGWKGWPTIEQAMLEFYKK